MATNIVRKVVIVLLLCFDVLGTNRQNTTHKKALNDMSGWKQQIFYVKDTL